MRFKIRNFICLALLLLMSLPALGETASLIILYTNDIHDHVRPGYGGIGGLPYISGYIASVRAKCQNILLLDAGDVTEKGDMVTFLTDSLLTYEAMDRIGYDAITVGNHERDRGIAHVRDAQAHMPHVPLLCINWLDSDGRSLFPASKIFDVHGIKVAVIGLTLPGSKGSQIMDTAQTGKALEAEAERLKPDSHIQVALGHVSSATAQQLSKSAPEIDVFASAHSHELLQTPIIVEETGAIIVQAGSYAKYIGRLELTVDLDTKKITSSHGEVVEVRHSTIAIDKGMEEWIAGREKELCPTASLIVGRCAKPIQADDMARLTAAAIRERAGVDVAFCHTREIMRSPLPQGPIDVNAFFLTGGQRGSKLVTAQLTGQQIDEYLLGLLKACDISQWAGFKAELTLGRNFSELQIKTSLTPDKTYSVAMPQKEWNSQFVKIMKKKGAIPTTAPCQFSFTDALASYVEKVTKTGKTIDAEADSLEIVRINSKVDAEYGVNRVVIHKSK